MSFRIIPKLRKTALAEIGWNPYPVDDGQIVYSYDEFYMYMYLQHEYSSAGEDRYRSEAVPVAMIVNEDEWYIPNAVLFKELGILEQLSESLFTYTESEAYIIFEKLVEYIKKVLPDYLHTYLKEASIILWLNDLKYNSNIDKLILNDDGEVRSRKEILESVKAINVLKSSLNIQNGLDPLAEAVAYQGISDFYLKHLLETSEDKNIRVSTYVDEFNDFDRVNSINKVDGRHWLVSTKAFMNNGYTIRCLGFEYKIHLRGDENSIFAFSQALPTQKFDPHRLERLHWIVPNIKELNSIGLALNYKDDFYSTYNVYDLIRKVESYYKDNLPDSCKDERDTFNAFWNNGLKF